MDIYGEILYMQGVSRKRTLIVRLLFEFECLSTMLNFFDIRCDLVGSA